MSLFVTVRLDLPVLETTTENAPDANISIEQQSRCPDGSIDLTVWASGGDVEALEEGLDVDGSVDRWIAIGGSESRKLYQIRLTKDASSCIDYNGWTDGQAVVLSTERTEMGWTVEALLHDRSVLQEFAAGCESNDVPFDLLRISDVEQWEETQRFGLTELQSQTLLTAAEEGFYSVPRQVNLGELAEPLDVSHQALSERLRRGLLSLINNTLAQQYDQTLTESTEEEAPTTVSATDISLDRPITVDP